MFDWIDKLREKPEHVRLKVALGIAGIVTAVIVFVWLSVLSLNLTQDASLKDGDVTSGKSEDSPFRAIGEFFTENAERLGESWSNLRSIEYGAETFVEEAEEQEEVFVD